jgi:peptidoglycan/xylan/chitin deacetylase (PgdA/CDA1 family)
MRAEALRRVARLGTRLRGRLRRPAVVLLYHRITDTGHDPYHVTVSRRHFDEHLQVIRELAEPVRLSDVADGLIAGTLRGGTVAVTFDDGYHDNLDSALPLLDRHEIPATVFMTTGRIGRDREFWWDELERIFLHTPVLPHELSIRAAGHVLDAQLANDGTWATDRAHEGWSIIDPTPPTAGHAAFQAAYRLLHALSPSAQTELLDALLEWSGAARVVRSTHRALEVDEVVTMAAHDLIDIGAHTVRHPALDALPLDAAREEVVASKHTLEEWLGRPVTSFAYPYGQFSDSVVTAVRQAGYRYACACLGHPVRLGADPYLIPRVDAPDVDGDALRKLLLSVM